MDVNPNNITFSLTQKEYVSGILTFYLIRMLPIWLYLVVVWLGANGLIIVRMLNGSMPQNELWPALCVITGLMASFSVWMVLIVLFVLYRASKSYDGAPELFMNLSAQPNGDGLLMVRGEDRTNFPWALFKKVYITRDFLILTRRDKLFNFFPLRCFSDRGNAWHCAISERLRQQTGT